MRPYSHSSSSIISAPSLSFTFGSLFRRLLSLSSSSVTNRFFAQFIIALLCFATLGGIICLFCNSPAISLSAHSLSISCLAAGSGSQRHYQPRKPSTGLLFGRYATLIIQRDDRRMDSWNVFAPSFSFGPLTALCISRSSQN